VGKSVDGEGNEAEWVANWAGRMASLVRCGKEVLHSSSANLQNICSCTRNSICQTQCDGRV